MNVLATIATNLRIYILTQLARNKTIRDITKNTNKKK